MDDQLANIAETVAKAGGGGIFIVAVVKWFISKSLENAKEVERLKEEAVKAMIADLKAVAAKIELEVKFLSERIFHNEQIHVKVSGKMDLHAEKFKNATEAIKGFVANVNARFEKLESETSEVIKIGKEIALIRAKKKAQQGGG